MYKGIFMDKFCPNCGKTNIENASYCQNCGFVLPEVKDDKITPKSDKTPFLDSKKLSVILIAIIIVVIAFFAYIYLSTAAMDVSLNINSAFLTDNIIGKNPVNGQYLIMNVSVKNNGNSPLTVSSDQFAPMINNKTVQKYSVFDGSGTDLQKQVQIPGGESKNFIIGFDIDNQTTPDTIEFKGPISWAPTYTSTTNIKNITPGVPFDGMNLKMNVLMDANGDAMGMKFNMSINVNESSNYEKTSNAYQIKETTISNGTTFASIAGQSNTQNSNNTSIGIINLKTGLYTNGSSANTLPKNLTKNGDSITIDNSTYTIVGSEIINILGHKINCWKVEGTSDSEGQKLKATMFYDKTTRQAVKLVIEKQNITESGATMQVQGSGELLSTNMPLIGVQ